MGPAAPIRPRLPRATVWRTTAQRLGIGLLALLYCFVIAHVASNTTDGEFQAEHHSAQGLSFSDASALVLCPTTAGKEAINAFSAPPASGNKDVSKGYAAAILADDHAQRTAFAEHTGAGHAVVLALWRSAILFPFHVFW